MKKKVKIIAFIIILISLVSCKDMLHQQPISSISSTNYWKTGQEAVAGLNGMYVLLRDIAKQSLVLWGDGRSEEFQLYRGSGPSLLWHNRLNPTIYTHSHYYSSLTWASLYKVINAANLVIHKVPNIDMENKDKKDKIMAQAYATRAYIYFLLTRLWGKAIIRTKHINNLDPNTLNKKRSSVDSVFALIKSDIKRSVDLFPNNEIPDGRNKWSKPSVNTLKAAVYLWTAKVDGGGEADLKIALSALNDVINNADVKLLSNYKSIFAYDNKGNKEILFAIHFGYHESGNDYGSHSYPTPGYLPPNITKKSKERIEPVNGSAEYTISDYVRKQFKPYDQRGLGATFSNIYVRTKSGKKKYFISYLSKYNGTAINGVRRFLDDIIIFRYADVLLMKAEARNALGKDPAYQINQVRKRAYGNHFQDGHVFVSGSKAYNNKAILHERLLEFTLEGKRWFDLIRFHKAFDLVPSLQKRKGQKYLLLWPVPLHTISLNSKLTQNPGY